MLDVILAFVAALLIMPPLAVVGRRVHHSRRMQRCREHIGQLEAELFPVAPLDVVWRVVDQRPQQRVYRPPVSPWGPVTVERRDGRWVTRERQPSAPPPHRDDPAVIGKGVTITPGLG
ncbi:MAG: hypothetical protein ACYCV4_02420 [Dermatophilaceae bacterium]